MTPFMMGTTSSTIMQSLGGDRIKRAGCSCEKVVFVTIFYFFLSVTLLVRSAVRSRGA